MKFRDRSPNLISIIFWDLFFNARLHLLLLCLIVFSGISVVLITYKTKKLIVFYEEILLEKEALEVENRHLMLEEKVLSDFSRIECFVIKNLSMKYIDPNERNEIYVYE